MTDAAVVIPFRGDGGGPRDQALAYVRSWWATYHPTWPVLTGTCPTEGWCKAAAVTDALTRLPDGVAMLVVADADVLCPDVEYAAAAVAAGTRGWAMPHQRVYRLTPTFTTAVLAGAALPQPVRQHRDEQVERSYQGMPGGGMVVLPAALYAQVPIDARFVGYGQEDASWGHALTVVAGRPWCAPGPLWHLWHPPQPRLHDRVGVGSAAGLALYRRYAHTTTGPAILAILNEAGARAARVAPGG